MSKGKRETTTTSRHSKSNSSKKFVINKKIFSFIFIVIIIGILIYFIPKFNKTKQSNIEQDIKSSNIENVKTIIGLEDIEIFGIDIESRSSSSIFNIKIHNKSNNSIPQSKVHFYAIDSEGKTIFGMPIDIPELKSNEISDFKVFCTDDISNTTDYNIVAIREED